MSSAAVGGHHSGAGPLSLMSCVRESSPQPENEKEAEKNTSSKKKFWNVKRWFKRKQSNDDGPVQAEVTKDTVRSRSTSELSDVEDDVRRRSTSSMHPTLSLSHDSVFQSPHSGSSDMELDAAQSSSSLSISQPFNQKLKTELCGRLRLRRGHGDTSEDDEGLPRSPCNSPTTADGHHNKTVKDLPTKSHSTCSDGSLLSMGSSEMDEDSYGLNSRHSSKLSLQDKRSLDQDSDIELGPSNSAQPLNHSAAHHRVAVRPKRTHGAPRRKRAPPLSTALPATPEVNEDSSIRSNTPEGTNKAIVTELFSMSTKKTVLTESQLKCSSLPPGLVGPGGESKLNRSKSNSGSKSQDAFSTLAEPKEEKTEKTFLRKLIRSSGKKKKAKEKHQEHLQYTSSSTHSTEISSSTTISSSSITTKRIESKPIAAPRSSAATRQRVQPKNIPITSEEEKPDVVLRKQSPEKSLSPFDLELENRIKQRQTLITTSPPEISTPPQSPKTPRTPVHMELENLMKQRHTLLSTSPSKPPLKSPPQSPKAPRSPPVIIKSEFTQRVSRFSETFSEEKQTNVKLGNLTAFHRKIVTANEDDEPDHSFKSLTELTEKEPTIKKPVVKSHSFKALKEETVEIKTTMAKAQSSDSLKVDSPPPSFDTNFTIELRTNPEPEESNHDSISSDILKDVKEITNELVAEIKDDFIPTDKSIKDKTNELIMAEIEDASFANKELEIFNDSTSGITISGPSHTAIVNVTSNTTTTDSFKTTPLPDNEIIDKDAITVKEVSVTKIQLRHETVNTTTTTTTTANIAEAVPEFFNKQLNKVEPKPDKNVIFTMTSPKVERQRPVTLNLDSDVNMEIIEKDDTPSTETPSPNEKVKPETPEEERKPPITLRYKKNDKSPAKTPESPKKILDSPDRSSQESVDSGILRKKSFISSPKNEEPSELMKVFARRSRIYSDQEAEEVAKEINDNKTRDSDKENDGESPVEERKKSVTKLEDNRKVETDVKVEHKEIKEPLIESTTVIPSSENISPEIVESTAEVTLRKSFKPVPQSRSFSLNIKNAEPTVKKQIERKVVTNYWSKSETKEKTDEIITSISQKEEHIKEEIKIEPKNFNQRKAEWEKRAQLAQKNNVP